MIGNYQSNFFNQFLWLLYYLSCHVLFIRYEANIFLTLMSFQARGNEDPSGRLRPEIVDEVGEKYATVVMINGGKKQQENHAKLIQVQHQ